MRCVVAFPCSPSWPRLASVAAIALCTAACSANSSRFSDGGAPSDGRPTAEVTGTVAAPPALAINSASLPPPAPPPQTSQWDLPPTQPQQTAQSVPPPVARQVPVAAAKPAATPSANNSTHLVVVGDTLHKIARQYSVSVADLTAANNIDRNAKLKVGTQLVVPQRKQTPLAAQKPLAQAKPLTPKTHTPSAPVENSPPPTINKLTKTPPVDENKGIAAPILTFRKPVNGRVISGFGPKPNGTENPGVNFAVPEGTPVKAAEDGVVAYASSDLKPYGNLVMIRHADGYVTTYSHASEILVKRDELVKRGQVIAKSGQTGNVSSPQLHFEIRKGATPVDPMPFLERGAGT